MTLDFLTELTDDDREDNSTAFKTDVLAIAPMVSPHRICRTLQEDNFVQNDSEANSMYLLRGIFFRCDSISEKEYINERSKESQQISVDIKANRERDIHLVAVLLATHKLNPKNGKPDCGRPEVVNTGVNHRKIVKGGNLS
jgi:hypothetical protein